MCVCADADEEDFGEYVAHRTLYKCIYSNMSELLSSFAGLLFMVALYNIFALWFLLSSFFSRLISAIADWMSTILLYMMWP